MNRMLGYNCKDLENNFAELLASEMIDKRLDYGATTRRVQRCLQLKTTVSTRLMRPNATVSGGIGAYLAPSRRKTRLEGWNTNVCNRGSCGEYGKEMTWVCSVCCDEIANQKEQFFSPLKNRR